MKKLKVLSPYNLELIKEIPLNTTKDMEEALETANNLFSNRKAWLPAYKRVSILEHTIRLLTERKKEFAKLASTEGGKPLIDSQLEVDRAIMGIKLAMDHIGQLKGEQIPMGHTKSSINRLAFTFREPIGIVASVSAFNHPLNLIIHQTVTAIAVGAPVIIKPALTTPLSCLTFIDLLKEAGLPKGWCQAIVCENSVAEQLVTDKRIAYFSFIGSAKVGWYLRSKLSAGTACALEHGGAAPVIVEKDADIQEMIPSLLKGGFYHAGQVCVSIQRIFAHENIANELSNTLAEKAKQLIVGDPLNSNTDVGPLILPQEVDRVEKWVNEAVKDGAKVLCGGKRISKTCFEPTILLNPTDEARVSSKEIFGPVVCIYSYAVREEAIKKANALPFAFQAAVFTANLETAFDTAKKINASAVMINDHTAFRVDWMPFGGYNVSGIGIGGIPYSMHEMTREKMMVIKSKVL